MWISSMKRIRPSGARPSSYFVSTRIRPRARARSWPKANMRRHSAASSSKVAPSTSPRSIRSARETVSSWAPFSAFVDGVTRGCGSGWFFRIPSGSAWPAKRREPAS